VQTADAEYASVNFVPCRASRSILGVRQQSKGQTPFKINEQELIKTIQEDEAFRPTVQTAGDKFFGLPPGTQVVFIATPILFQLMLVKDNNSWKILWAEPYTGG